MNSKIAIVKTDKYRYPVSAAFRPSKNYPEYFFEEIDTLAENHVYDMVRNAFALMGYDKENYNNEAWNPLGEFIKPGDYVLLKPNLVMHMNRGGEGTDCLYTQPSIVAAVVDYVVIALKGTGRIVVGDAPMQECKFDELIRESGYDRLEEYYKTHLPAGISFELADFREVTSEVKHGMHFYSLNEGKGLVVDLKEESEFDGLEDCEYANMRITNYDPTIMSKHHNKDANEYCVNKYVLNADVVINLPKPKTHRKAGVTIAMKNLVGISARKEYLPHHTSGSLVEGGDEYKEVSRLKSTKSYLLDKMNYYSQGKNNHVIAFFYRLLNKIVSILIRYCSKDVYYEGSWYGNDTISKTIVDLNKIFFFADKNGEIRDTPQRKYLIVADMIISGEKEGPVMPSPKDVGIIAVGENPVCFDECIAKLMGAKLDMISTLKHARCPKGTLRFVQDDEEAVIVSNASVWDGKTINTLTADELLYFKPTSGWREAFEKQ